MHAARPLSLVLAMLVVGCAGAPVATPAATETPAEAYWRLRAQSEAASYIASYETSAGSAVVYALPPNRRLDVEETVGAERVTIAIFYRVEGTYACDMTHHPRICTVVDQSDATPHAQPGTPALTRIERAPGRTVAGLAATCFTLIALSDERLRREVCFSPDGVLVFVSGPGEADGPEDRVEAVSVSAVRPEQLDPLK